MHPEDDLSGLQVYILPHIAQFRPEWVPELEALWPRVELLIIGARTARKDLSTNHVISETLPGLPACAGPGSLWKGLVNKMPPKSVRWSWPAAMRHSHIAFGYERLQAARDRGGGDEPK